MASSLASNIFKSVICGVIIIYMIPDVVHSVANIFIFYLKR